MFDKLLEKHGGQLLQSASQTKYHKERQFGERFDGGMCSALSTLWIVKRAQGRDFFKYLDSNVARGEIAQLQSREDFASDAIPGVIRHSKETVAKMEGGKIDLKLGAEIVKQQNLLMQFIKQTSTEQHQWRCDLIREETGLDGVITKHVKLEGASKTVKATEGYTIFSVNGKKGGHAMGIYASPNGGVRFYDPNFGEAYFERPENFETFLVALTGIYVDHLGGEKSYETTSIPSPVFPHAPEDYQKATGGDYLPLGLVVAEAMTSTEEERQPLLSDFE